MANRQIIRRILIGASISLFLIFILFIRPQGPPSPAVRAPGHLDKSAHHAPVNGEVLKGNAIMPKLGNETIK